VIADAEKCGIAGKRTWRGTPELHGGNVALRTDDGELRFRSAAKISPWKATTMALPNGDPPWSFQIRAGKRCSTESRPDLASK